MTLLTLLLPLLAHANPCLKNQAAFDVGSGSTKAVLAEVNTCQKRIQRVLFEEQIPVAFAEAFEKSVDKKIPASFLDESLPRLKDLSAKIQAHHPTSTGAVFTSTFRKSRNGAAVAKVIAKTLRAQGRVISQKEEARLGYWAALAERPVEKNAVVWDIGGGSMQMINAKNIFEGRLASVSFKNRVVEEIQKKQTASPNPLGADYTKAVALAKKDADVNVPKAFRAPGQTWIGIGGVLGKSLSKQLGKPDFTADEIRKALDERSKLTDAEVGGDYAATDVTNLALVLGYMESLKLEKIETVKASLEKGWLLQQLHQP